MKFRRFVLVCMYYVYFDVFLSTKITGNSHTGTCTNPHLRIDHVDHQHYPMVVTHGVLANHVKVKDTFSLSQSELYWTSHEIQEVCSCMYVLCVF